jgi:RHS repeat-associated protein
VSWRRTANGTGYFWHPDWEASVRLSSLVSARTYFFDRAFAPYGEMYDNFGNTGALNFTGDTQDSFTGLFDTPNRELSPVQGRWLSPDAARAGWNLYVYVNNDPLNEIDPSGLCPGQDTYCDNHPDIYGYSDLYSGLLILCPCNHPSTTGTVSTMPPLPGQGHLDSGMFQLANPDWGPSIYGNVNGHAPLRPPGLPYQPLC